MTFDTYYGSEPWSGVTTNQRQWYDPFLREVFYREAIYSRYVTAQFNIAGPNSPQTTRMTITSLIPPHGNSDPLSLRQMWMPSSYMDTFSRDIIFSRFGSKMALHKYDDLITYWKKDGVGGLRRIVNSGLGTQMVQIMDKLARNAFFDAPYKLFGDSAATGFGGLEAGDKMTTTLVDSVRLGMAERGVPFITSSGDTSFQGAQPLCITSPGVIHDLIREAAGSAGSHNQFVDIAKYADPSRVLRGEIGTYRGVRFIEHPAAILYNCGEIEHQTTIAASVAAGQGASPDLVDSVRTTGQPDATNYITVADASGFEVNDYVTLHVDRTSSFGVTNGVDYRDGKMVVLRVEKIDGNNISFQYPLLEPWDVDLGGGVYGYVTKGRHVHASLFLGAMDGVVMGVGQPPRIYTPLPVDDFESMYRVSWDGFFKYQLYEPSSFEVVFTTGTNRTKGRLIAP